MIRLPYISNLHMDDIRSIDDVDETLHLLDAALAGTELDGLRNFNTAYLIITRKVQQSAMNGTFQDVDFLNSFDAIFAKYYLLALRDYIDGRVVPRAWQAAFDAVLHDTASPLKLMALGVNAHVNNDIPQVLIEASAHMKHRRDYDLVNGIIGGALDDIFASLQPYRSLLSPNHALLRPLYKPVIKILIRTWRNSAWHKSQQLRQHMLDIADIERKAYSTGLRALLLPL